ncbi:MAG: phage tail tape measure protein, partial [Inquilinus sp.]|uniref:phage tail tape measure protein n=1 Tax=Inquilinus sp. TaxID=1932117 RepID=UPI003F3744BF
MADRNLGIRLSLKDADVVKRGLEALGKEGQAALRKIEQGSQPASRGLLAVNAVAGDLKGSVSNLAGSLGPLGSGLSAMGPAGLAAAVGIGAAIAALAMLYTKGKEALAFADDLGDVAEQLGLTAEQLQEIRASSNGLVEPGQVDGGLGRMQKLIGDASKGGKEAIEIFRQLGVSFRDSTTGEVRSNFDVYRDIADAIASIESPAQRASAAAAVFGREVGGQMVPVLAQGSKGLEEAAARFRALGAIISNETVAKAGELQQQLDDLGLVIKAQVTEALVQAGPVIIGLAQQLGDILPDAVRIATDALQFLAEHADEALTVMGALTGLAVGAAFGPWGAAIGAVAGALGGLSLATIAAKDAQIGYNDVVPRAKQLMRELTDASGDRARALEAERRNLVAVTEAEIQRAETALGARRQKMEADARESARINAIGVSGPDLLLDTLMNEVNQELRPAERQLAQMRANALAARAVFGEFGDGGRGAAIPDRPDVKRQTGAGFRDLGEDVDDVTKKIADFAQKSRLDSMKPLARQLEENRLKYVELGDAVSASLLPDEKKAQLLRQLADAFNANNNTIRANAAEQKKGGSATKEATSALEAYLTRLAQEKALVGLSAEEQEKKRAVTEAEAAALKDYNNKLREKNTLTADERAKVEALAVSGEDLRKRLDSLVQDTRTPEEAASAARAQIEALRPLATTAEQIAAIDRGLGQIDQHLRDQDPLYKELDQIGTRAFDRIGSAITEAFTQGEASAITFESVVQGVVSEIMQDFLRLAAINPLKNALFGTKEPTLGGLGGLLGDAAKWLGGFLGGGNPAIYPGSTTVGPGGLLGHNAVGNAYDWRGKVHAFARGGIVDRPTIFPFAKGVGLMGEAGPEGILPLMRLPSGKLGVGTDGGGGRGEKVKIEVIDQVGVKVQATETRDGRGGRRIEMVLADA